VPINPSPTIPLDELQRIVQEMLESSIVDVLAAAATVLAAGNSRFPPIIAIALGGYAGFLSYLGYHAIQDLYNAGLRNEGKAFMAGIFIGLASVSLATILGLAALSGATIITTNVIFAMIGALVGNSYNPKPAMDYIKALIIASLAAIAISAVALRIPEPIGNTFLFGFLMITIVAMGVSAILANTMG